jgi:hypothetical protein
MSRTYSITLNNRPSLSGTGIPMRAKLAPGHSNGRPEPHLGPSAVPLATTLAGSGETLANALILAYRRCLWAQQIDATG